MSSLFDDENLPSSVKKLQNELRVMLDKRGSARQSSGSNVISFSQAADRSDDAPFLDEYQSLARSVMQYFYKGSPSYEDFMHLKSSIQSLSASAKQKEKGR